MREEIRNIVVQAVAGTKGLTEAIDELLLLHNNTVPDDDRINYISSEAAQQDWNDLHFKAAYEDGFIDGAKWCRSEIKK
jgi:hypothetical protein